MKNDVTRLYESGIETAWVHNIVFKEHLKFLAFTVWYLNVSHFLDEGDATTNRQKLLLENAIAHALRERSCYVRFPYYFKYVCLFPQHVEWRLLQIQPAYALPPFRAMRFSYGGY